MAYQKDQTGITQTASNNAATLAAAEVAAGIIKSHDTLVKRFEELKALVLTDLKAAVEVDNAMFKAEEASAPARAPRSGGRSSGSSGGPKPIDNPGSIAIKGGKFDGKTVAEVFEMPASVAEDFGYVDKEGAGRPGSQYIQWMTTNQKNPFMQKVATTFIESKRAGSEAA